ncbi:MAG: PBP1A family penicillin-binding protein [Deltaproteobacteria bacterium]|nr:PBP1A family penicillin-binding protein [Deltaproteobacteria bacterium]
MVRAFFKFLVFLVGATVVIGVIVGLGGGLYVYFKLTRDLPRIERIGDYQPKSVTSIYSSEGVLIGEVYDERRYPVEFKDIPEVVRHAFLAAEDANFYEHPGIDIISIARALLVNLRHQAHRQGASTITQQVVKSLLLSREKTYERKAKEAILSYRLEQALTKDEIFSIYLNEVFLGSTAYGVKAAAQVLFHKDLSDISLAEAAYLAALPQRPSYLSRPENRKEALERQQYVLRQMLRHRFITSYEHAQAIEEKIQLYAPDNQRIFDAPYFVSHVVKLLEEQLGRKLLNPGGFNVYTTADLPAHRVAERVVREGLREVDRRRGWRGPLAKIDPGEVGDLLDSQIAGNGGSIEEGQIYRAIVASVGAQEIDVQVGDHKGKINLKDASWANRLRTDDDRVTSISLNRYLKPGHVIEVLLKKPDPEGGKTSAVSAREFEISQTPDIEGAFVVANALTGEVKVIVGGYDFSRSQFNRATQALRQPGSAFKPVIYLAAVSRLNYTPATLVPDSPISLMGGNGQIWSPSNYDRKFLGPITLRTALQRSRNVVSVYLLRKVGVDAVIETARSLGITTPIPREMSISLGTAEVSLIELVRAYGAFASGGWLADQLIIKSIKDRHENVIFEKRPAQKRVIDENDAFLMANMMKGVVERGTAQVVKSLGKPVAGKTGTTNEQMDAWFIGYTPEWVGGVWVGFDVKRTIGRLETGGKAAAPIFLHFMEDFLADELPLDFDIPSGVIPIPIHLSSGRLASQNSEDAFIEYFKSGTEPRSSGEDIEIPRDYLSGEEF